MKITDNLKTFGMIIRNQKYFLKVYENESHDVAELMRNTHAIEKGLCITNPILGYGHNKQKNMLKYMNKLKNSSDPAATEAKNMAVKALRKYLQYHDAHNFSDPIIEATRSALTQYPDVDDSYGGTVELSKDQMMFNTEEIEKFFNSRHSIRDFDDTPVNVEDLEKALILAQRTPSSCNRQGYRAYVLSHEQSLEYAKTLLGIGTFSRNVNRFILITGKVSAYRPDEINQYIVSASMYAAYLTLTLHLYGIGACAVHRPVFITKEWIEQRRQLGIPEDEQLICLLAIGNMKDKMTVPKSHRFSPESTFKIFD